MLNNSQPQKTATLSALALLASAILSPAARAQTQPGPYPSPAPIEQYLMADKDAEIALARTAAPPSVSGQAEILVLGRDGYTTAVKGTNGFTCLVERGFAASTDDSVFWNPKNRSPICINAAAVRTHLPGTQLKAKLALAGKSKAEIAQALRSALDNKEIPTPEPGAMAYMMSKQQYLNDDAVHWHPHLMFFVSGDAAATWGANLPGSQVLAANDPEEGMTIFFVVVSHWSDGSPGPEMNH
jgi:hypothetical protein